MDLSGSYKIPASRDAVWAALNDPDVLKDCIPGCEALDKRSETEFDATVLAKIGPVKARFAGKVILTDLDPPAGYHISGEGSGGVAGFAKGGAAVRLTSEGSATVLSYEAQAQIGGKLAQLGSRLVDGVARKMADEFFAAFADRVAGASAGEAVMQPVEETVPSGAAPIAPPTLRSRIRSWFGGERRPS